jgi:multimeric flavodoxin WrbA
VIDDEAKPVLGRMASADVIVMATPLYFFSASAQLKAVVDRMFSLYKWNNEKNTFESPLRGKTMILLASAYEDTGLDALEKPFRLTADYTGMKFESLLVAGAGVSGNIIKLKGIKEKTMELGMRSAAK